MTRVSDFTQVELVSFTFFQKNLDLTQVILTIKTRLK